jgi:hypothetical protein
MPFLFYEELWGEIWPWGRWSPNDGDVLFFRPEVGQGKGGHVYLNLKLTKSGLTTGRE